MVQAQSLVQRPIQVVLEQIPAGVVLGIEHGLRKQPVHPGVVAQPATSQLAALGRGAADLRQWWVFARWYRLKLTVGALQIGRQQAVEFADNDQRHIVGGIPLLAQGLELVGAQLGDFGPLGTLEPQFNGQLIAGLVAQVLAIEPALQMGVMPAVLALHHLLGGCQGRGIEFGARQQGQQQVEHLALVLGRRFDHECGVGIAGKGIPLAAQGLHALLQAAFALGVDTTEQ